MQWPLQVSFRMLESACSSRCPMLLRTTAQGSKASTFYAHLTMVVPPLLGLCVHTYSKNFFFLRFFTKITVPLCMACTERSINLAYNATLSILTRHKHTLCTVGGSHLHTYLFISLPYYHHLSPSSHDGANSCAFSLWHNGK